MTMLAETLQQILSPLASGGAWAVLAGQGAVPPFIVYRRIPSAVLNIVDGAPPRDNNHVQIDVYARTYAQADQISKAIDVALYVAGSPDFGCVQISSPSDDIDPDTRLYRIMTEFSIWT